MPHTFGMNGRHARFCIALTALVFTAVAHADAPRIFAITDVRIVTGPGEVIESGTVVMRRGLIETVGADVAAPPDAQIIAGQDGWTVYPAMIDAASAVGLETESENGGRPGRPGTEEGDRPGAPHELATVHPEQAVVERLDTGHSSVERHRELGFAIVQVLPEKGVFRGASAVMLTADAPAQELVLSGRAAEVVALETSSFMAREYPSSTIGAVATVRQVLLDAQRQREWTARYGADPVGLPHPEFRASDAALQSMIAGERQVVFVALRDLDPPRFSAFMRDFGLRGVTVARGLGHGVNELRAAGMPILLPLELPEEPDVAAADELNETTLRDLQSFVRAPALPASLADAGVEFAFVTAGMKSVRDFHANLARVVEAGLSPDRALAATTTTPARLLGLDRVAGTIAPGKQANLIVVEGELFTEKPALRLVFVNGYRTEIEAEATVGDPNAIVDPRGTWEIVSEVMGRRSESRWTITGSGDEYAGFSESDRGGKNDFERVALRGNALTVVSASSRGEIEMTVVIDGERLEGSTEMESARGSATMNIEGRRVAGPESSER